MHSQSFVVEEVKLVSLYNVETRCFFAAYRNLMVMLIISLP